jgi:ParB-like chromosome segregation protein Spo0J
MAETPARHGILPALAALAVPIDSVRPNPANTRKHEKRSLDALKVSLDKYGQRKPIVVQKDGMMVRAGNGMLAAARELGWTHIAAVVVDEPNVDAVAYELMDNKSAELSTWEQEALALQLSSLKEDDIDLALTGFTSDELEALFAPPDSAWGAGMKDIADGEKGPLEQITFVVTKDQAKTVRTALAHAQKEMTDTGQENVNENGNALAYIAEHYLGVPSNG